jgi:hypothetical protein
MGLALRLMGRLPLLTSENSYSSTLGEWARGCLTYNLMGLASVRSWRGVRK